MLKLNKKSFFETNMFVVYALQTGVYEAHTIFRQEKNKSTHNTLYFYFY